ncbi:MAG TPA: efflux RND transporter periplasmic adaptor subunit [Bacteroidota bacterium]|nr:efflux RND transporter periplasmic adaptor subunit [Bacteroidota bacterium]
MKRKLIFATGAVVIAIGGYLLVHGGKAPRYDYRFDSVSRGDVDAHVITTGTLNAVVSVDVGTQVSGVISNLYADFNSVVKKGEVIARIDTTLLAQAVEDARAGLAAARVKAANDEKIYQREKALVEKQLDSQANLDSAMTAAATSRQALLEAKSTLDQAKINLGYATIRAPVDGTVINRAVNIGETVAASFASPVLYTIANDLSRMQVLATVDESDVGMISTGQKASFTVEAYPGRTFEGIVSQIRLAPVSIQNVVNYTVVIDVNNADLKLMPGMTADITVDVADARNVLRVPNLALRFRPPPEIVDSAALRLAQARLAGTGNADGVATESPGSAGTVNPGGAGLATATPDSSRLPAGAASRRRGSPLSPLFGHVVRLPVEEAEYGITNLYPVFIRPAYRARHHAGRGRVWILDARNELTPVYVSTGVSDGRLTEVTSDSLKPGERLVLGAWSKSEDNSSPGLLAGGPRYGRRF